MISNNINAETDPRFPSGSWQGYWVQHEIKGRMSLMLDFHNGSVSGVGADVVGHFIVRGRYCLKTGQVA